MTTMNNMCLQLYDANKERVERTEVARTLRPSQAHGLGLCDDRQEVYSSQDSCMLC